jgi:hypothetical protein
LHGLLTILIVLGFTPVLINLYLQDTLSAEAIACVALGLVFLVTLAKKLMRFILPVACVIIFIWTVTGSDTRAFGGLLSHFLALGLVLFGFYLMIFGSKPKR